MAFRAVRCYGDVTDCLRVRYGCGQQSDGQLISPPTPLIPRAFHDRDSAQKRDRFHAALAERLLTKCYQRATRELALATAAWLDGDDPTEGKRAA